MSGFNKIARLVDFCQRQFYARCRWLLRKKQSRGHGVHSPFAFNLITNIIYSPYSFYAFHDIPEILSQKGIDPNLITRFNYLSFRLVYYLKPKEVLEVNAGIGINTLFLTAASRDMRCSCVEDIETVVGDDYDAIFINLEEKYPPAIRRLQELGHHETCWVVYPINKGAGKQFWDEIVLDERTRMTFDLKDTGIVFLRPDLQKGHYLV